MNLPQLPIDRDYIHSLQDLRNFLHKNYTSRKVMQVMLPGEHKWPGDDKPADWQYLPAGQGVQLPMVPAEDA